MSRYSSEYLRAAVELFEYYNDPDRDIARDLLLGYNSFVFSKDSSDFIVQLFKELRDSVKEALLINITYMLDYNYAYNDDMFSIDYGFFTPIDKIVMDTLSYFQQNLFGQVYYPYSTPRKRKISLKFYYDEDEDDYDNEEKSDEDDYDECSVMMETLKKHLHEDEYDEEESA